MAMTSKRCPDKGSLILIRRGPGLMPWIRLPNMAVTGRECRGQQRYQRTADRRIVGCPEATTPSMMPVPNFSGCLLCCLATL